MRRGYVLKHYTEQLSNNPELLVNRTKNLEDIGFDSIWITDHILLPKDSRLPKYQKITEILTTLSYLAGTTETISLGLSTLVLPARDTILTAKQLSTMHYFFGDRLITSFGAGWAEGEFDVLGKDFYNRGRRFNEQLQVLKSLFQGEDKFSGEFHQFENAEMRPRREGLHTLPLYIAGNSNRAIERSIKYGDGWHPINLTPEEIATRIDQCDELEPANIIIRFTVDDRPIDEISEAYEDLGITHIVYDDSGDIKNFERIIQYVRSFQEFQP